MVQKVIRDRLDAILHWNISLVGGFLGAYAILLHAGNFGSAQTGNLMEMGAELVSMEWFNVLRVWLHWCCLDWAWPPHICSRTLRR